MSEYKINFKSVIPKMFNEDDEFGEVVLSY